MYYFSELLRSFIKSDSIFVTMYINEEYWMITQYNNIKLWIKTQKNEISAKTVKTNRTLHKVEIYSESQPTRIPKLSELVL